MGGLSRREHIPCVIQRPIPSGPLHIGDAFLYQRREVILSASGPVPPIENLRVWVEGLPVEDYPETYELLGDLKAPYVYAAENCPDT